MKDGDFIEIEFVGKVRESGEIFDLTDEKLAKEKGIFNPKTKYGPITIILGAGHILKGLEKEIEKLKVGDKKKIELEPKDAFGVRSPNLLKVFPLNQFKKQGMLPVPGQFITLQNNVKGRVLSVSGGRVRVDFNNPLAGKSLEYDIKVNKLVTDKKEQIQAVFRFYTALDTEKIEIEKEKAKIAPPATKTIPAEVKKLIADGIIKYIKGIKEVEYTESFKKLTEK